MSNNPGYKRSNLFKKLILQSKEKTSDTLNDMLRQNK